MLHKHTLNKFILILIFFISSHKLYAAGPITHAYFAKKWILYHEKFNERQEASFIRGTLFPDIRYLGVISRDRTHTKNLTLNQITNNKNPFFKGKDLHAFVDEEREKFVVERKMYKKLRSIPGQIYIATFLKLLEDEILYEKESWDKMKKYLQVIDLQERKYKINKSSLLKWHSILIHCFSMSPSEYLARLSRENKGFANIPPEIVKKWQTLLPVFAKKNRNSPICWYA